MMWEDKSVYNREGKRISEVYVAQFGDIRVSVVKGHIYYQNHWVLQCEPFFRDLSLLKSDKPAEEAQRQAFILVKLKIEEAWRAMCQANKEMEARG